MHGQSMPWLDGALFLFRNILDILTNTNDDHCLTLSRVLVLAFVEALLSQEYLPNPFRAMKHQHCHGNQCVEVLVAKSCLTLCHPVDCSPPGEWVASPSSRGSSWPRDQTPVSCTAGRFFSIWATREALWIRAVLSSHPGHPTMFLSISGPLISSPTLL